MRLPTLSRDRERERRGGHRWLPARPAALLALLMCVSAAAMVALSLSAAPLEPNLASIPKAAEPEAEAVVQLPHQPLPERNTRTKPPTPKPPTKFRRVMGGPQFRYPAEPYTPKQDFAPLPASFPFKDADPSNALDRLVRHLWRRKFLVLQVGNYPRLGSALMWSPFPSRWTPASGSEEDVSVASVYLTHRWCVRHGYGYLYIVSPGRAHMGPFPDDSPQQLVSVWNKVPNALYAFEVARRAGVENLVVVDSDVVPRQFNRTLEDWLDLNAHARGPNGLQTCHVFASTEFAKYSFSPIYPHVNSGVIMFRVTPQGRRALWSWWFEATQVKTPEELKRNFVALSVVASVHPPLPSVNARVLDLDGVVHRALRTAGNFSFQLENPGFKTLRSLSGLPSSKRGVKVRPLDDGSRVEMSFVVLPPFERVHSETLHAWTRWLVEHRAYLAHLMVDRLRWYLDVVERPPPPQRAIVRTQAVHVNDTWDVDYLHRDHPGDQERFGWLFWRNLENAWCVVDAVPIQATSYDLRFERIADVGVPFEHACCPKPKWVKNLLPRYARDLENMTVWGVPHMSLSEDEWSKPTEASLNDVAQGAFALRNVPGWWDAGKFAQWSTTQPGRFDALEHSVETTQFSLGCLTRTYRLGALLKEVSGGQFEPPGRWVVLYDGSAASEADAKAFLKWYGVGEAWAVMSTGDGRGLTGADFVVALVGLGSAEPPVAPGVVDEVFLYSSEPPVRFAEERSRWKTWTGSSWVHFVDHDRGQAVPPARVRKECGVGV